MPRRKQPSSLYEVCVNKCVKNIILACEVIGKRFPDNESNECQREILHLKSYLMSNIPSRLFEVFCAKRNDFNKYHRYLNHSLAFPYVMLHPNMTVFRRSRCDAKDIIFYGTKKIRQFWIDNLPNLKQLVVLDLPRICTDEILQIISTNCPLLEELTAVSAAYETDDLYVSNEGLYYLRNLARLRILKLDDCNCMYYQHMRVMRDSIIDLLKELPNLEELRLPSAGRIVTSSPNDIGPLALKKITLQYQKIGDVTKLAAICPLLNELTLELSSDTSSISIIEEISDSNLELSKLNLKGVCISGTLQVLKCKGYQLTQLFLDTNDTINFDNLLLIGKYCPHLQNLCIECSLDLFVPECYQQETNIFSKLKRLDLGVSSFCIKSIVSFFSESSRDLQTLIINIQINSVVLDVDGMLIFLLDNGHLKNIEQLWINDIVSKNVIISIINRCEKLRKFALFKHKENADIFEVNMANYILENNLDLEIINTRSYDSKFRSRFGPL